MLSGKQTVCITEGQSLIHQYSAYWSLTYTELMGFSLDGSLLIWRERLKDQIPSRNQFTVQFIVLSPPTCNNSITQTIIYVVFVCACMCVFVCACMHAFIYLLIYFTILILTNTFLLIVILTLVILLWRKNNSKLTMHVILWRSRHKIVLFPIY